MQWSQAKLHAALLISEKRLIDGLISFSTERNSNMAELCSDLGILLVTNAVVGSSSRHTLRTCGGVGGARK